MRSRNVLAALLVVAVLPSLRADPFADTQSKEEAVEAFAGVEEMLAKEDTLGLRSLYEEWKLTFNITYSRLEDNLRYAYFVATLRRIIETNRDPNSSHWSGLNRFSAMSSEEFATAYSIPLQQQDEDNTTAPLRTKALLALPRSKNWVAEGKVTSVKSQRSCYCCWAFAGTAAVESRALIALRTKASEYDIDLSEQQLVDCARGGDYKYSFGCKGGQLQDPFKFAAATPFVPEAVYPYMAKDGSCRRMPATNGSVVLSGTGYVKIDVNSATAYKQALMESPFSIGYYSSEPSMRDYKGGIYNPPKCGTPYLVDHAVLLVGYDDTTKSWLFKNSWGSRWGEKGFFRMAMQPDGTQGTCQMYTWAIQPTAPRDPAPRYMGYTNA